MFIISKFNGCHSVVNFSKVNPMTRTEPSSLVVQSTYCNNFGVKNRKLNENRQFQSQFLLKSF